MNHMSQQIQQVTVENQQLKRILAFVRTPPPIIREGMNHGIDDNDTSNKLLYWCMKVIVMTVHVWISHLRITVRKNMRSTILWENASAH